MERERQTVECSPGPSGFCGCASKRPAWWTHHFSSIQAFWLADSAYLSTDLLWSVSHSWYFTVFIRKICSKMPSPAWVQQRTGKHPKKGKVPLLRLGPVTSPHPTSSMLRFFIFPLLLQSVPFWNNHVLGSETAFLFSPLVSALGEMRSPEKWDTQAFPLPVSGYSTDGKKKKHT